jgi:hypothetical protein
MRHPFVAERYHGQWKICHRINRRSFSANILASSQERLKFHHRINKTGQRLSDIFYYFRKSDFVRSFKYFTAVWSPRWNDHEIVVSQGLSLPGSDFRESKCISGNSRNRIKMISEAVFFMFSSKELQIRCEDCYSVETLPYACLLCSNACAARCLMNIEQISIDIARRTAVGPGHETWSHNELENAILRTPRAITWDPFVQRWQPVLSVSVRTGKSV